ncbi:MAG: hypothetical protein ACR2NM_14175 [Bythopirellula sp.]
MLSTLDTLLTLSLVQGSLANPHTFTALPVYCGTTALIVCYWLIALTDGNG